MDDRALRTCVDLTIAGSLRTIDVDNKKGGSVAFNMLKKLRKGAPVVLCVDDPILPKRKRVQKPLLFLTPVSVYGGPSPDLLVSLQSHGCELVNTNEKIRPITFYRMGLSSRLSKVLAEELNSVFFNRSN